MYGMSIVCCGQCCARVSDAIQTRFGFVHFQLLLVGFFVCVRLFVRIRLSLLASIVTFGWVCVCVLCYYCYWFQCASRTHSMPPFNPPPLSLSLLCQHKTSMYSNYYCIALCASVMCNVHPHNTTSHKEASKIRSQTRE